VYGKYRSFIVNLNGAGVQRSFLALSLGTAVMFILTGLLFASQSGSGLSSQHVGKLTVAMSNSVLSTIIGYEVPYFTGKQTADRQDVNVSALALRLMTSINPDDPRSLLGHELPGFDLFDTDILVAGKDVGITDLPFESSPPPEALKDAAQPEKTAKAEGTPQADQPVLSTKGKKVVFIYNTHNRESWIDAVPQAKAKDEPNLAMDPKKNVTLISKRVAETLEKNGIGSSISNTDFTGKLNEQALSYALSYAQSLKTVKAVLAQNRDLQYLIDIHRDSLRRDKTTIDIKGEKYARIHFVIGMRNKNWEKNEKFALEVHDAIEKKYPGLSKGIFGKKGGNGEYNQSVSSHAILIEVGGVDNTLEECYRTADVIAEAVAGIYWNAEKVNAVQKPKRS
jgi:stage II sporulation protein P